MKKEEKQCHLEKEAFENCIFFEKKSLARSIIKK